MRLASTGIVKGLLGLFLVISVAVAGIASAATLIVDGSGQLIGARDIPISGVLYEVEFRDDSFTNLFGDASGLDAQSETEARALGQALIDEVFVDSASGLFDTDPELISGCENTGACGVLIPFAVNGSLATNVVAENRRAESVLGPDEVLPTTLDTDVGRDLSDVTLRVYVAHFKPQTPTPAVPALGISGLIVLASLALSTGALAIHRRRSGNSSPAISS